MYPKDKIIEKKTEQIYFLKLQDIDYHVYERGEKNLKVITKMLMIYKFISVFWVFFGKHIAFIIIIYLFLKEAC